MPTKEELSSRISEYYNNSEDVRLAIDNMRTDSVTDPRYKLIAAANLIEIVNEKDIPRELPIVYIASGIDIELPLLLQRENIVMVDPIFENDEDRKEYFSEKIELYGAKRKDDSNYTLEFDYGKGKTLVNIEVRPENFLDYEPEGGIGVILEYLNFPEWRDFYLKDHLLKKLNSEGVFYYNPQDSKNLTPLLYGFKAERIFVNGIGREAIYSLDNITEKDWNHITYLKERKLTRKKENSDLRDMIEKGDASPQKIWDSIIIPGHEFYNPE